jgi:hypothetical protein
MGALQAGQVVGDEIALFGARVISGPRAADTPGVREAPGSTRPTAAPDLFDRPSQQQLLHGERACKGPPRTADRPTRLAVSVAFLASVAAAYLFDMPFLHGDRQAGGLPIPSGLLLVILSTAHQLLRGRWTLQQMFFVASATLFFAEGLPLIVTPFAPVIRLVFYGALIGSAVALYEWGMPSRPQRR